MTNPSGRFQLIEQPTASPGVCAVCGAPKSEPHFVDTGLDYDFYGRVIFCKNCVSEMAASYDLITPDQYEEIVDASNQQFNENVELKAELERMNRVVDNLADTWVVNRKFTFVGDSGVPTDEPVVENPNPIDELIKSTAKPESKTGKSSTKQGLASI